MDEIKEKIRRHFYKFSKDVAKIGSQKLAEDTLSERRAIEQIELMKQFFPLNSGENLLEIGCGIGIFIVLSHIKCNLNAYGVEADKEIFKIAQDLLSYYGLERYFILNSNGEFLPFKDNTFDIVCSFNVLEHTVNPERVLRESIRVLKRGGYLHFVIPNYGSFWEGHYGLVWFPYMSKIFAKFYVKLLGRDSSYIDQLTFISYFSLKKILRKLNDIKVIDFGEKIFERRLQEVNFSEWACLHKLKRYVIIVNKLKLVKFIIFLSRIFKFNTPLILTLIKI